MNRNDWLVYAVWVGFTLAIFFTWVYGSVYLLDYPYDTIFCASDAVFSDFQETWDVAQSPYAQVAYGRNYFPATYALLRLFSFGGLLSLYQTLFLLICLLGLASLCFPIFVARHFDMPIQLSSLILPFASFGFLFMVDRGNIEMLVYLLVLGFFAALLKRRYMIAAVLLALATCSKLYPAVFVLLLLREKRWKAIVCYLCATVALFAGAMVVCGALDRQSFANMLANMGIFKDLFVLRDWQYFNHSFFGAVKSVLRFLIADDTAYAAARQSAYVLYTIGIFLVALCLSVYVVCLEKKLWKSVLALCIMLIAFPYTSFDYTLVYLSIPITLFLYEREAEPGDTLFAILMGLCIVPLNFYYLKSQPEVGIYVVLRPLLFALLLGMSVIPAVRAGNVRGRIAAYCRKSESSNREK